MKYTTIPELYRIFLEHPAVTTDSRQVIPGSLFFALKGEHFNGNAFAEKALEAGAARVILDEEAYCNDERCLLAPDVLTALQELALHHRRQFKIPVIAITGTNGKTTTKELTHAVLSTTFRTLATEGNLNNHIGVPLTILRMTADTEIAIIEMGANHPGEIDRLCRIAEPGYGLITNIGKAHLEGFGGFEGVVRTKTELYRYLAEKGGSIFLNTGHPLLTGHAGTLPARTYGLEGNAGVLGTEITAEPLIELKVKIGDVSFAIHSNLFGSHNAENILAAACIGNCFGVLPKRIAEAVEGYQPENNRSQLKRTEKNTLILDAYNANPSSMEQAIRNFTALKAEKKALLLGDMLELGDASDEEHRQILELVRETGIPDVYLVGPVFSGVNTVKEWHCFDDSELAALWFGHHELRGATVLVKGSRGIRLEKITTLL